jgi:hypothetical protein
MQLLSCVHPTTTNLLKLALEEALAPTALAKTALPIPKTKKARWHCIRQPKEISNWWSQFLTKTQWLVLQNDRKR